METNDDKLLAVESKMVFEVDMTKNIGRAHELGGNF